MLGFLRLTLICTIINLIQCCATLKFWQPPSVDEETKTIVEEFTKQANKRFLYPDMSRLTVEIKDNIEDLSEEKNFVTVGICYTNTIINITGPYIVLRRKSWNYLTPVEREQLLFHELGHCILEREHDETKIEFRGRRIPTSIMYPHILDEIDYREDRERYIDELFLNAPLEVKYKYFKNIDPEKLPAP